MWQRFSFFSARWRKLSVKTHFPIGFYWSASVSISEHDIVLPTENNCLRDNSDGRPRYRVNLLPTIPKPVLLVQAVQFCPVQFSKSWCKRYNLAKLYQIPVQKTWIINHKKTVTDRVCFAEHSIFILMPGGSFLEVSSIGRILIELKNAM